MRALDTEVIGTGLLYQVPEQATSIRPDPATPLAVYVSCMSLKLPMEGNGILRLTRSKSSSRPGRRSPSWMEQLEIQFNTSSAARDARAEASVCVRYARTPDARAGMLCEYER